MEPFSPKLSGKQIAAIYVDKFGNWVSERDAAGDWGDYIRDNKLNRTEVAKECGFDRGIFRTNPTVAKALERVEKRLESQNLLFAAEGLSPTPSSDDAGQILVASPADQSLQLILKRAMSAKRAAEQRVKAVEEQNAILRAEVRELKDRMRKLSLIDEHLKQTGRLLTP